MAQARHLRVLPTLAFGFKLGGLRLPVLIRVMWLPFLFIAMGSSLNIWRINELADTSLLRLLIGGLFVLGTASLVTSTADLIRLAARLPVSRDLVVLYRFTRVDIATGAALVAFVLIFLTGRWSGRSVLYILDRTDALEALAIVVPSWILVHLISFWTVAIAFWVAGRIAPLIGVAAAEGTFSLRRGFALVSGNAGPLVCLAIAFGLLNALLSSAESAYGTILGTHVARTGVPHPVIFFVLIPACFVAVVYRYAAACCMIGAVWRQLAAPSTIAAAASNVNFAASEDLVDQAGGCGVRSNALAS